MTGSVDVKNATGLSFWTRAVLAGVAVLCILLVGGIGVLKYKMDRAEVLLSAPDTAFSSQDEALSQASRALGYGGFLGSAYNLALKQDSAALGDMRLQLKTAQDAIARLDDKAPATVRHDLEGILSIFAATLAKAEQGLTAQDLPPLAATLPMLEARLQNAAGLARFEAQDSLRGYSGALTFVAWACLIGMAALAVGLFLALRNRYAAPLQALAQSVHNISKGDMSTPVWGMERTDAIGTLAREIDLARYHFSQIPDLSLMSDQGPVRLRFEGDTKSVFQAMMNTMAEDYQRALTKTEDFTNALQTEQEILTSMSVRMNKILSEVQLSSAEATGSTQNLVRNLADMSKVLADSHERLASRTSKLIPFMQERAQNMAEVTSIIGTHAGQTLQKLAQAEQGLRQSAAQSQKMIADFGVTTNEMSERLFAALNIMQASSKVLNETTETTQSRFNEAVETLGRGESSLQDVLARAETRLKQTVNAEENLAALAMRTESSAEKMEVAVYDLMRRNDALNDQVSETSQRLESMLTHFDSAQKTMGDAVSSIRRDSSTLNVAVQDIRANNDQLLSSIQHNSQTSFTTVQSLTERAHALMQRLEVQIAQQAQSVDSRVEDITSHGHVMAQQVQATTTALAQTVSALKIEQDKFVVARGKLSETVSDVGTRMEQHAVSTFARTEHMAQQSHEKLATLAGQMDTVLQRLNIMGQLTGTLGAVAGQLGQLLPALTQSSIAMAPSVPAPMTETSSAPALGPDFAESLLDDIRAILRNEWADVVAKMAASKDSSEDMMMALQKPWDDVLSRLDELSILFATRLDASQISKNLQVEMQTHWHKAVVQIEAMNDQLAQMMVAQKDQIETRLMVMDKKLKSLAESPAPTRASELEDDSMMDRADLMNNILSTMADMNDHLLELDSTVAALQDNSERKANG